MNCNCDCVLCQNHHGTTLSLINGNIIARGAKYDNYHDPSSATPSSQRAKFNVLDKRKGEDEYIPQEYDESLEKYETPKIRNLDKQSQEDENFAVGFTHPVSTSVGTHSQQNGERVVKRTLQLPDDSDSIAVNHCNLLASKSMDGKKLNSTNKEPINENPIFDLPGSGRGILQFVDTGCNIARKSHLNEFTNSSSAGTTEVSLFSPKQGGFVSTVQQDVKCAHIDVLQVNSPDYELESGGSSDVSDSANISIGDRMDRDFIACSTYRKSNSRLDFQNNLLEFGYDLNSSHDKEIKPDELETKDNVRSSPISSSIWYPNSHCNLSNENRANYDESMDIEDGNSSLTNSIPQLCDPVVPPTTIQNPSGSPFKFESINASNVDSSFDDLLLNQPHKAVRRTTPSQFVCQESMEVVEDICCPESFANGDVDVGMSSEPTVENILLRASGYKAHTESDAKSMPTLHDGGKTTKRILPKNGELIQPIPSSSSLSTTDQIFSCSTHLSPLSEFELVPSNEICEVSTNQKQSSPIASSGQTVTCIFLPQDSVCHHSNEAEVNSNSRFLAESCNTPSRSVVIQESPKKQIVRCILPTEWISDPANERDEDAFYNIRIAEHLLGPHDFERHPKFHVDHRGAESTGQRAFSESFISLQPEAETIFELPQPDTSCMLPYNESNEDHAQQHVNNCETILYGVQLRKSHAKFVNSIPGSNDSDAQNVIREVLGNTCKEFVLENNCNIDNCLLVHSVQLNFDLLERDSSMVCKIFTKWFLDNTKVPNFKVLLKLMSSLTRDYGDDLLSAILDISQGFFKLPPKFRRSFGIKLLERMATLLDLQRKDAIRTTLIFNLARRTAKNEITNLLEGLGVFEPRMTDIFESVSCIWHFVDDYELPPNTLFDILKECLQSIEITSEFKLTKEKIIAELMKVPRYLLKKQFHIVDRFLRKFFPSNSRDSYNLNFLVLHGDMPARDFESEGINTYKRCRVKSTGPVNWDWEYWDLMEIREKACHLMMGKISQENQDTELPTPTNRIPFADLKMESLLDDDDQMVTSARVLPSLEDDGSVGSDKLESVSPELDRLEEALNTGQFRDISRIILSYNHPEKKAYLNSTLRLLTDLFASYPKEKLPHAIYEVLDLLPRSYTSSDELSVRTSFVRLVNSLVLIFYERMDYKSALKLLKTVRVCGENALEYTPYESIDLQTFAVLCSDIHLECRCFLESLRILLYGNCMNYIRYNIAHQSCANHVLLLELVVLKMFKIFLRERLAAYSFDLFRAILLAQGNFTSPINIGIYYEVVLCSSFFTSSKGRCGPHAAANLYITIDRTCGNEVRFRSATYRSLLVELLRAKAPEDVIRRTLQLCQKLHVYPAFTVHSMSLGSHLVTEEFYLYVSYFFKYCLEENDRLTLLEVPCSIKINKCSKPSSKPFPILEDIAKVSNEIPDAFNRLEEALKRIVGNLYEDRFVDFSSPNEAIIPSVGMETLMKVLAEQKRPCY